MTRPKIILTLLMVLAGIFIFVAAGYLVKTDKTTIKTAQQNNKALIGGPFSLINHHGKSVTNEDFRGKYMLIYFGYTFCPDICPTELQIMGQALDLVPKDVLADITPIFITVDPARDTVEIMAQYAPAFHPNMVGLTGSDEQVKAVKKTYRVYAAPEKQAEGADPDAYMVSHTSYTYLMDRDGEYITHFKSRTDPAEMARRLEEIIR
ncbi:MAG: SCO family protein [Emcibacter sp.]|nr:SCO family protein [Emcibacter sp.]